MAHRVMALTLVSAHNLKDVNLFSRMEVYGIVSVYGDPRTRQRSKTDRDGARHPTWDPDEALWFAVPPTAAAAGGAYLHVLLRTERLFSFGDADVGEVFIPLADLLVSAGACASGAATGWQCASYQVRKVRCTERRGILSVCYHFGPVMAPLLPDGDCRDNASQLPPWQYPPVPKYQLAYPPSCPRMMPVPHPGPGCGAAAASAGTKSFQKKRMFALGLDAGLLDGGFRGMLGGMPLPEKSAYDGAGHGTAAADAGAGGVAV